MRINQNVYALDDYRVPYFAIITKFVYTPEEIWSFGSSGVFPNLSRPISCWISIRVFNNVLTPKLSNKRKLRI